MALIPEQFKNSIVSIGVLADGETKWIGTGFLVGVLVEAGYEVYLVSNKHVFEQKHPYKIRLVNKDTMSVSEYDLLLRPGMNCLFSDEDNVDIGIVSINGKFLDDHIANFGLIDINKNAVSSTEYLSLGGASGDGVYMLGYPMGLIDVGSNEPLCRSGCVARISMAEIDSTKNFLLDLQNFPGNSGSPIFLKPEIVSIKGTKHIETCYLIGIIHGYIPYEEKLLNLQTDKVVEIRSENSGIAVANPVEFIRELINKFKRMKEEAKTDGNK